MVASARTFDARLQQLLDAMLSVGSEQSLPTVLQSIIDSTCDLVGARFGALSVLDDDGHLSELLTVGIDESDKDAIGRQPEGHGVLGALILDMVPIRLQDVSEHPDSVGFPANHPPMQTFLGVPVRGRDAAGNLYVAEKQGGPEFTPEDQQVAEAFAAAAGVAVDNARMRARLGAIALLEDRERIARDLHDKVIQRLFAAGMALQTALPLTTRSEVASRIAQAIEDLDDTIREIRYTIFALERPSNRGVRVDIFAEADGAREALGFSPDLKLDGPIDGVVTDEIAEHMLASLQEALANVAKHAQASRVDVLVHAGANIFLRVEDDGVGLPDQIDGGRGLDNMERRAVAVGGTFSARRAAPDGGTIVEWQAPLV